MRDIRRLGPGFFAFTVEVHGDLYSSGVLFPAGCTDPQFTRARPLVAGQFDLLNAVSADVLHESVAAFLTDSGDAERFAGCGLVSVSAHVADAADPEPHLSLAYGDDGVYLSARFRDGVISEVELNLP